MGLKRIVVGHTPHSFSKEKCSGNLLAVDSSLSRSFRSYGNFYCPINVKFRDSSYATGGHDCSTVVNDNCEGSIRRISRRAVEDAWDSSSEEIFMSPNPEFRDEL